MQKQPPCGGAASRGRLRRPEKSMLPGASLGSAGFQTAGQPRVTYGRRNRAAATVVSVVVEVLHRKGLDLPLERPQKGY